VRGDLNMFNKNLLEFHQDIAKLKAKFKSVNYQIKQLKDEIKSRDDKLNKEYEQHNKITDYVDQEKSEVQKVQKQL